MKHWDFAVMTVAAVIPMFLYLAYVVAQFSLLALSRARETAADHWSCECTGDGDALASALVKIAYGMGKESAARKEEVHALVAQGRAGKREAHRVEARARRAQSMRAMGIFEPRSAEAMQAAFSQGIDPDRALAALRWDVVNPWAKVLEKMSSHPLVARRIQALEQSGLPGAPRLWSVLRAMAGAPADQVAAARSRFGRELVVAVAPWVALAGAFLFGWLPRSPFALGLGVAAAGIAFFIKQSVRYPGEFVEVGELTELLERLDAGPVGGIGVIVTGRVAGRGMPGYVLSPDLVVADSSGFVPLLYRQPIPWMAELFGLFRAERYLGRQVVARGWYRRQPGPAIELREIHTAGGLHSRSWQWVARYAAAVLLVVVGVVVMLSGLA